MVKWEKNRIIILYVLLFAGGLWHILDWFGDIMGIISGPFIIAIAILQIYEFLRVNNSKAEILFYSGFVIVSSFFLEYTGVESGVIFGNYDYGNVLSPQIADVPFAIGFAWISTILASIGLTIMIIKWDKKRNIFLFVIINALFMTLFDYMLEPVAVKLGYWSWESGNIPVRNYIAWFAFGSIYSYIFLWLQKVREFNIPPLFIHSYIAQIIYFLLVMIA